MIAQPSAVLAEAGAGRRSPQPKPAEAGEKPAARSSRPKEAPPPKIPAVAAILATKPTTPAECMRAAKMLADLGRPDLAKGLLKKVLDAKLDPQQLADLGEQIGSPVFLDLAGRAALAARGQATGRRRGGRDQGQAARRQADRRADPAASRPVGRQAAARRWSACRRRGEAAIGPLLAVLADPARAAEHANVRTVLAEMGRPARGPLVAIVERADPKLTVQAILVLAEMNDRKVGDLPAGAVLVGQKRRGGPGGGRRGAASN